MSDGQLLGGLLRFVVEMLSRDQSGAVVSHLRHQATLAEAMLPPPEERPPALQRHPWRRYVYRQDPADDDPPRPARDKTPTVDVGLVSGAALDGAEFHDGDDEDLPEQLDRKLIESRVADAIDDALESDAEARRSAERFEAEMIALVSDE